ncbi:MAG: hypothetical protein A2046_09085 [Bacteroidetes bacterium GWA2_30_7]|nr:MAG: hypothetical protein A2046_09085 [Bacteroidetes bacterium GWA2_30_7]
MDFLEQLSYTTTLSQLEDIIENEYQFAYDFFLVQSHNNINLQNKRIEQILTSKLSIIKSLDFSKNTNRNFISLLILTCERIGAFSLFEQLYKLDFESNANIGYRLKAVYKFTIGIRRFDDYIKIFDEILFSLKEAFDKEEDNIDVITATFIQYYAKIVLNFGRFNKVGVSLFKQKIIDNKHSHFILNQLVIDEVLVIDTSDNKFAFDQIQFFLDKLLNRSSEKSVFDSYEYLIESKSEYNYPNLLSKAEKSFEAIRNISVSIWKKINDKMIYDSLGRGTSILTAETQLYAYLNSFGNSHYAKMIVALEKLPFDQISSDVELFDWGCGQGLASIVVLEKLKQLNIANITLIEPSEIAIKRASLHIRHFNHSVIIKTLCKKIDMLEVDELKSNINNTKIHLFSNILDIDGYSLNQLLKLIRSSQKGSNYFVCVSPYINDVKADRVDSFSRYFSQLNTHIPLVEKTTGGRQNDEYWNCNEKYKGDYCYKHSKISNCGCEKKWTRVIRVFKIEL